MSEVTQPELFPPTTNNPPVNNVSHVLAKGRVVIYRQAGHFGENARVEVPSIVVRVLPNDVVDLTVFKPGLTHTRENVPYSKEKEQGTWCWPDEQDADTVGE